MNVLTRPAVQAPILPHQQSFVWAWVLLVVFVVAAVIVVAAAIKTLRRN
jgi:hypothetical protein